MYFQLNVVMLYFYLPDDLIHKLRLAFMEVFKLLTDSLFYGHTDVLVMIKELIYMRYQTAKVLIPESLNP